VKKISLSSLNLDTREYGQGLAYKLACEQLAEIANIEEQCINSGATCEVTDFGKVISLQYLGQAYQVSLPDIAILRTGDAGEIPLRDRILILHYIIQAKGTPLSDNKIAYKELPEGTIYSPTFTKRAIKPLLDNFGSEPDRLLEAAKIFGGRKADYGDVAVTIDAFSRVPITLILWQGDEELPPSGSILFDGGITDYLSTEDITVLCETIAWRLVKSYKFH